MRKAAILGLAVTTFIPSLLAPVVAGATVGAVSSSSITARQETPVDTEDWRAFTSTPCMNVTDSVFRLYTAYFGRTPEAEGFNYWLSEYGSGNRSLEQVSEFFSDSEEFVRLYGSVDNGEFVYLVYLNIMERQPDSEGYYYWLGRLDEGTVNRGQLMLSFSESQEYIVKTDTFTPTAGLFGWYETGTSWDCSYGSMTTNSTGASSLDFVVTNFSDETQTYVLNGVFAGQADPDSYTAYLAPWSTTLFTFPAEFEVDQLTMSTSGVVGWGAVWHSTAFGPERGGWGSSNDDVAQRADLDDIQPSSGMPEMIIINGADIFG